MIITDINPQKRKGRYNLYVDGGFYSGIDAETIVKAGLKTGIEVTKERLEELVIESETRSAFEKLIGIISRQMYSKRDIYQKLLKYGYSDICIQRAIEKAEEYNYIDDKAYAKALVESKPLKSKLEIKNALFIKGIKSVDAEEYLEKISQEEEAERAIVLAKKYMKNREADQKTMAGLYAFLSRRGFGSASVRKVLESYKFDQFED